MRLIDYHLTDVVATHSLGRYNVGFICIFFGNCMNYHKAIVTITVRAHIAFMILYYGYLASVKLEHLQY